MKILRHCRAVSIALLFTSVCLASASVWAADAPPAKDPVPTKEMRAKMAVAHEKMAVCLRSDRPVAECRQEMMHSCQQMSGQGCGMMGERHKMMMHGEDNHATPGSESEHKH